MWRGSTTWTPPEQVEDVAVPRSTALDGAACRLRR
jgi:hypothetical protein